MADRSSRSRTPIRDNPFKRPHVQYFRCWIGCVEVGSDMNAVPGCPAFSVSCGLCGTGVATIVAQQCAFDVTCGRCREEVTIEVRPIVQGSTTLACTAHMDRAQSMVLARAE